MKLELHEEITEAIERKQYTVVDFKNTFDTIDHNLLLSKLQDYGIRAIVYN